MIEPPPGGRQQGQGWRTEKRRTAKWVQGEEVQEGMEQVQRLLAA